MSQLFSLSLVASALTLVCIRVADATEQVYIPEASTIRVLNPENGELHSVDVDGYPVELAVGPGGREVFALVESENGIDLIGIETQNNTVRPVISTDLYAEHIAASPTQPRVYIVHQGTPTLVSVVNTAENVVERTVNVGRGDLHPVGRAWGAAVDRTGSYLYVAHTILIKERRPCGETIYFYCDLPISELNLENGDLHYYEVGDFPGPIVADPLGRRGVIVLYDTLQERGAPGPAVRSIFSGRLEVWLPGPGRPFFGGSSMTVHPNGDLVYVTNNLRDVVYVVDLATSSLVTEIPVGLLPRGLGTNPTGDRLYVAVADDPALLIFDTTTYALVERYPLDFEPHGLVVASDVVLPIATATPLPSATPSPSASLPPTCAGDCGGDGKTTVDDIIMLTSIALGTASVSSCLSGDTNLDGEVTVDEILQATMAALGGCSEGR